MGLGKPARADRAYCVTRKTTTEEVGETLAVAGRLTTSGIRSFLRETAPVFAAASQIPLTLDLSSLVQIDSAGALALLELEEAARAGSRPFRMIGASREIQGVMDLIDLDAQALPVLQADKGSVSVLERLGGTFGVLGRDFIEVMTFLGELITALSYCLFHPRSIRYGDVVYYMKKAGAEALPIVGLISLLIGLIMAFMSSLQLKQFGANIYVASLVSISIVKELGPMMTAIIVAGRSGSAFAAEIGTMMVNEEVDALVTMGFEPVRFLAVPKVIAAMIVVPLLTLYAMLFGILGGVIVGVTGLDLTLYTYVQQSLKSIDIWDVTTSLLKSGVFAALIAGIGCQRGFEVSGGAEGVGEATTSAVVSAIFLIIVADSIFAILLHYL